MTDPRCDVVEGCYLLGQNGLYRVETFLGEGSYGIVARCKKQGTNESLSIKILKNKYKLAGAKEIQALEEIRKIDANKHNLVSFVDSFLYKTYTCVAFEVLDQTLHNFLRKRNVNYLNLNEIRIIGQQLMVALNGLKSIGMVHCDIKMDNIMLVDHKSQPFRVKLIDFGLAKKTKDLITGVKIQNIHYRAPEVILGLPLDERLDLWTVGNVLSCLYTGYPMHPKDCEYNILRAMVAMQGMPDATLLDQGQYSYKFFTRTHQASGPAWKLHSPENYVTLSGKNIEMKTRHYTFQDLIDAYKDDTMKNEVEQFVDLLKQMIAIDPGKRITPSEALKHQFFITEPPTASSGNSDAVKSTTVKAQQKESGIPATFSSQAAHLSVKEKVPKGGKNPIVPSVNEVHEESQTSSHLESLPIDSQPRAIQHVIQPHNDQLMDVKKCSSSSDSPGDASGQRDSSVTDESYFSAEDCFTTKDNEITSSEIQTQMTPDILKTCNDQRASLMQHPVHPHSDKFMSVDVKKCSSSSSLSDNSGDANIQRDASVIDALYFTAEHRLPPADHEPKPASSSERDHDTSEICVACIKDHLLPKPIEENEFKSKETRFRWFWNLYACIRNGLQSLRKRANTDQEIYCL